MRTTRIMSLALAATTLFVAAAAAQLAAPGGVDLSWSSISAGAGTSTGGGFEVNGTIGQSEASSSAMTGGGFEVRGGFWAGGVVPAPTCSGDIAPPHNGLVDIDDLVVVITHWGATGNDIADITHNNIVNIDDLVALITQWGACP